MIENIQRLIKMISVFKNFVCYSNMANKIQALCRRFGIILFQRRIKQKTIIGVKTLWFINDRSTNLQN